MDDFQDINGKIINNENIDEVETMKLAKEICEDFFDRISLLQSPYIDVSLYNALPRIVAFCCCNLGNSKEEALEINHSTNRFVEKLIDVNDKKGFFDKKLI